MRVSTKPIAALAAVLLMLIGAAPTSAAPTPDGAYARFASAQVKGLVIVNYRGSTTVNAGIVGLVANKSHNLVGRSIRCNGNPSAANRSFKATGMTDDTGAFWILDPIAVNGPVRSLWIGPADGSQPPVCTNSYTYQKVELVGDYNGDAALGFLHHANIDRIALALVEKRPQNRARVSIAIRGLITSYDYAKFVSGGCGHSQGTSFFSITLTNGTIAGFKSQVVDASQSELDAMRSVRVRASDGTNWGCIPLSIIGILVA